MNIRVLFFFLFIPSVLLAQEEEALQKKCRVLFVSKIKAQPSKLFMFDGKKSVRLIPSTVNMSQVITLSPETASIELISSDTEVSEPTPGAPRVKIPAEYDYFYLIVHSDPDNEVFPAKLEILDAREERLVPGETLWVNYTEKEIHGDLGTQKFVALPNSQMVVKSPRKDSGYYKASFSYKQKESGQIYPIMDKSWWQDIESTYLGIIVDRGGRLPSIYTIRDRK